MSPTLRKFMISALIAAIAGFSLAQSPPPSPPKQTTPSSKALDLAKSQIKFWQSIAHQIESWSQSKREGWLKIMSSQIQAVPNSLPHFSKKLTQIQEISRLAPLEQVQILAELWRLRTHLRLIALSDPEVLRQVAGFDLPTLQSLRLQSQSLDKQAQRLKLVPPSPPQKPG